jgi:single-strand DNA-binding protein
MTNLTNSVQLLGRLGMDPKPFTFDSGKKRVSFSVATNEYFTDKTGEKVEDTQWHNVVVFGKTADIAEKFLKKGSEILLSGKLTTRSWDDKEGKKQYITEVVASQIQMLDKKKKD